MEVAMSSTRQGTAMAFLVGVGVAFVFALVISVLPAWFFLEPGWRAVAFAAGAIAAPPTVWFLQGVARVVPGGQRRVALWGAIGAMTFDGLAIGFIPGLYGQTGDALAWAAAMLLVAFASLLIAAQVMIGLVAPDPEPTTTA
jgi:hypothetical protein